MSSRYDDNSGDRRDDGRGSSSWQPKRAKYSDSDERNESSDQKSGQRSQYYGAGDDDKRDRRAPERLVASVPISDLVSLDTLTDGLPADLIVNNRLEARVLGEFAGRILGRGRIHQKLILSWTGCDVKIARESDRDKYAVVIMEGPSLSQLTTAFYLLQVKVFQDDVVNVMKYARLCRDSDIPTSMITLTLNDDQIGRLIGPKGDNIQRLQDECKVFVFITPPFEKGSRELRPVVILGADGGAIVGFERIFHIIGEPRENVSAWIEIDPSAVGLTIGKQGGNLKRAEDDSRARISLQRDVTPGLKSKDLIIEGTPNQIYHALVFYDKVFMKSHLNPERKDERPSSPSRRDRSASPPRRERSLSPVRRGRSPSPVRRERSPPRRATPPRRSPEVIREAPRAPQPEPSRDTYDRRPEPPRQFEAPVVPQPPVAPARVETINFECQMIIPATKVSRLVAKGHEYVRKLGSDFNVRIRAEDVDADGLVEINMAGDRWDVDSCRKFILSNK